MKKITNRQKQEIDFLVGIFPRFFSTEPTVEEMNDFVRNTALGKMRMSNGVMGEKTNPIFSAKRMLDISVKQWREDLTKGYLSIDELREEYASLPYGKRLIESVFLSVTPEYRRRVLGKREWTSLALTGFTELL